jgi:hypothetical protein
MKTTKWGKALNVIAPVAGATTAAAMGGTGDQMIAGGILGSTALHYARSGVTNAMARRQGSKERKGNFAQGRRS